MPLDRDLLQDCINHLIPFFNTTPDERQALVSIALFGSPVLENDIVWTGKPRTFTFNLINKLHFHDDTTSLVLLLESLQADIGEPRKSQLNSLIAQLGASSASKPITPADSETLLTPELSSASPIDGEVFISYARLNLDFVDRLRSDFEREKISYWIDKEGLSVGTKNWERSIRQAIHDCTSVVWVVSPASYASDYVDSEIAIAEAYDKTIYPVWADGDSWIDCVPLGKTKIQYVDMRGDQYTKGLVEIVAALKGIEIRPDLRVTSPSIPIVTNPENPYKGLKAFQEADAGKFFGREALVTRLVGRLDKQLKENQPRFLAVVGPSGAGKSSVVMAGMIPALKHDRIANSKAWAYIPRIVPGTHPIENLADALDDVLDDSLANIETNLLAGDRMLHRMVKKHASDYVVLYIDQFEELFTLTADENERQQFINLITSAATEPDGKLIVLLSMRADFFGHPLNYPALGALTRDHNEAVLPMSIAELRDAIVKPAQLPTAGLHFDTGLVAEIIFALRGRDQALAGALPLLQFTLERLFEERAGNRLTQTAYDDMGGVDGAIGSHSEAVFAKLPESSQAMLGQVFLPLVNIDEASGEPTRRRVDVQALKPDPDADALIKALIDNRLLQTGSEGESIYLEIAHEALFRSWERLKNWIDSVRGDLHLLREMRKAAQTWEESGRSRDFLWLGERGQEVADMLERLHPDLNDVEKAFARPEAEHLLDEIQDLDVTPARRSEIGTRLHVLKYRIKGAGLRDDGLPEIVWCNVDVPDGSSIDIREHLFDVQPFQMSKYLVTYEQFQAFVDHPNGFSNRRWWLDFPEGYQFQPLSESRQPYINYPRDKVSWYQATAFTRWLSYELSSEITLPTEAQWQWVARNYSNIKLTSHNNWSFQFGNTRESGIGRPTAVGMFPVSKATYCVFDLFGNLWEWCRNSFSNIHELDDVTDGNRKTLLGGSFEETSDKAKITYRNSGNPSFDVSTFGIRLVTNVFI